MSLKQNLIQPGLYQKKKKKKKKKKRKRIK